MVKQRCPDGPVFSPRRAAWRGTWTVNSAAAVGMGFLFLSFLFVLVSSRRLNERWHSDGIQYKNPCVGSPRPNRPVPSGIQQSRSRQISPFPLPSLYSRLVQSLPSVLFKLSFLRINRSFTAKMQARLLTTALLASAASLVSAVPVEQVQRLDVRQLASSDDLKDGKCAGNIFIFARGSTEVGNMVRRPWFSPLPPESS